MPLGSFIGFIGMFVVDSEIAVGSVFSGSSCAAAGSAEGISIPSGY